jgi:hypothetical protein
MTKAELLNKFIKNKNIFTRPISHPEVILILEKWINAFQQGTNECPMEELLDEIYNYEIDQDVNEMASRELDLHKRCFSFFTKDRLKGISYTRTSGCPCLIINDDQEVLSTVCSAITEYLTRIEGI